MFALSCFRRPSFSSLSRFARYQSRASTEVHGGVISDVEVRFGDEARFFNGVWLRENCRSATSFNHSTQQRNVLFYEMNADQTTPEVTDQSADTLHITWRDGHRSEYPLQWLLDHGHPGAEPKTERFLWTASDIVGQSVPRVSFDELLADKEAPLKALLLSLVRYGIGLVEGVPASIEGTEQAVSKVCFVQETLFGRMWGFTADMARGDTAYTNIALGAHTDNTYFAVPSGIQVFHCLHHDGTGGETLLVDGFRAAEDLRAEHPDAFDLLTNHRIHHQYIEPGQHLVSLDSVLKVEPVSKELEMIRYNHYDRCPIRTIPQDQMANYYEALANLSQLLTRRSGEHWLKLTPGTVIFVDNWRVLHGRASFTGNRRVCGCYLPRDDWMGKARLLDLL